MAAPTGRRYKGRIIGAAAGALLALAAGAAVLVGSASSKPTALPEQPEALIVTATPITRFKIAEDGTRFGALSFRGGLVLKSTYPAFGGISGFSLGNDNRFVAVTDAGVFLSGRLDLEGGKPTGLSDVMAAALKDDEGRLQAQRGRGDSESLTLTPQAAYVGLESVNEIWRYPLDPKTGTPLGQDGTRVPAPMVRDLRWNLGLESLAYVRSGPLKGALIGIGEDGIQKGEDLPGYIIGGPHPGRFTITKSGPFNATDLALAPNGDMYLLERHFSLATGVLMQLRRFALAEVKPGAVLSGTILGTFDSGYEIDNMEGLAVTTNAAGETLLTMISDDNFSPLQRTILLRFAVIAD
ncbi:MULTISPECIES: esterase-like activity of phytase family protein [unclassified Xanthobacter]|uniref:esterase-like activity of phytase family protein n=1 Tax=unclassified Xanthobacter TaxID=2623496 RepID=UPI001F24E6F5|nr:MULTISPECIES: esterase-like activity of phytase family protein [unclassified Xanthobacter]